LPLQICRPANGGQGKSPIGKIFMIGAVWDRDGRFPGRMRLARIANLDRENLHAFIKRNTSVGTRVITDGNTAYGNCRIVSIPR